MCVPIEAESVRQEHSKYKGDFNKEDHSLLMIDVLLSGLMAVALVTLLRVMIIWLALTTLTAAAAAESKIEKEQWYKSKAK